MKTMTSKYSQKPVKTNFWTVTYIDEDNNECIGIWESTTQEQLEKDLQLPKIINVKLSTEQEIKEAMIDDNDNVSGMSAESELESRQRKQKSMSYAQQLLSGRVQLNKDPIDEMLERQVGNITTTVDGQEVTVSAVSTQKPYTVNTPNKQQSHIEISEDYQQVKPSMDSQQIDGRIVELSSGEIIKIAPDGSIYERVWKDVDITKTSTIRVLNSKTNAILSDLPKNLKLQKIEWVKK